MWGAQVGCAGGDVQVRGANVWPPACAVLAGCLRCETHALLQVPALLRAGCTSLPLQRHQVILEEMEDEAMKLQKNGTQPGTDEELEAVRARINCKVVEELRAGVRNHGNIYMACAILQ